MTKNAAGIAVVQVAGLGAAYALVNGVDTVSAINPLEVIPLAEGAACVLEGPPEGLRALVREQRSADLVAVSVLEQCPKRVLNAFYGLEGAPLNGSLVVIEHELLGKIFEIAVQADRQEFGLVEIKAARGGQRRSALLLTQQSGTEQLTSEQEAWLRRIKGATGCQIERIDRVGTSLKNFFEGIE